MRRNLILAAKTSQDLAHLPLPGNVPVDVPPELTDIGHFGAFDVAPCLTNLSLRVVSCRKPALAIRAVVMEPLSYI
jgi:hypothetical protein